MTVLVTRRALIIVITVASLVTGSSMEATSAAPRGCGVKNVTQDTWFGRNSGLALARAIAQANDGDRLNVFGTCVGGYTISKDLTIAGSSNRRRPTTLSGGGVARVLAVNPEAVVTFIDLTVTRGSSDIGGGGGIAVSEGTTVTLRRVKVLRNVTTNAGGGIVNGGDLRLINSRVSRNHSGIDGGGIYNYGEVSLENVTVYGNTADGGGGGLFNEGTATLNRSRVRHNTAASGGGILSVNTLVITNSDISDNTPDDCAC